MLKHILGLLVLSILVVLFRNQFGDFLHLVGYWHFWLSEKLLLVFSGSAVGMMISHILALLLIPLVVSLVPAFIYWIVRRGEMPSWVTIIWVLWVILATIIGLR